MKIKIETRLLSLLSQAKGNGLRLLPVVVLILIAAACSGNKEEEQTKDSIVVEKPDVKTVMEKNLTFSIYNDTLDINIYKSSPTFIGRAIKKVLSVEGLRKSRPQAEDFKGNYSIAWPSGGDEKPLNAFRDWIRGRILGLGLPDSIVPDSNNNNIASLVRERFDSVVALGPQKRGKYDSLKITADTGSSIVYMNASFSNGLEELESSAYIRVSDGKILTSEYFETEGVKLMIGRAIESLTFRPGVSEAESRALQSKFYLNAGTDLWGLDLDKIYLPEKFRIDSVGLRLSYGPVAGQENMVITIPYDKLLPVIGPEALEFIDPDYVEAHKERLGNIDNDKVKRLLTEANLNYVPDLPFDEYIHNGEHYHLPDSLYYLTGWSKPFADYLILNSYLPYEYRYDGRGDCIDCWETEDINKLSIQKKGDNKIVARAHYRANHPNTVGGIEEETIDYTFVKKEILYPSGLKVETWLLDAPDTKPQFDYLKETYDWFKTEGIDDIVKTWGFNTNGENSKGAIFKREANEFMKQYAERNRSATKKQAAKAKK